MKVNGNHYDDMNNDIAYPEDIENIIDEFKEVGFICSCEREAKTLMKKLKSLGYMWNSGDSLTHYTATNVPNPEVRDKITYYVFKSLYNSLKVVKYDLRVDSIKKYNFQTYNSEMY